MFETLACMSVRVVGLDASELITYAALSSALQALKGMDNILCYAVKANNNLHIMKHLQVIDIWLPSDQFKGKIDPIATVS